MFIKKSVLVRVISLVMLFCTFSAQAMRLPKDDRVPGGIAVIDLGILKHRPNVYFQKRPVMVVQNDSNHWVSVVGIPLGTTKGEHSIYVNERQSHALSARRSSGPKYEVSFQVNDRKYPTQSLWFKKGKFAKAKPHKGAKKSDAPVSTPFTRRIEAEAAALNELFAQYTPQHVYNLGFIKPVDGRTSGVFGSQRIINGEPRARHKGFDIAAPIGTKIKAPLDGKVVLTRDMYFTGKTVVIDHGQGLYTLYAHLNAIQVKVGDELDKGDAIGTVGRTGRATGPHLHLGVSMNNARVNPALFFKSED